MAAKSAPTIGDILAAWETRKENDPEEVNIRAQAKEYVLANPDDFRQFEGKTLEKLVEMVDGCREAEGVWEKAGVEHQVEVARVQKLLIDLYLLAAVPKQYIGGDNGRIDAKIQLPGLGG